MGKKQCVAMLLAGGKGSRLSSLTKNLAKPAVPFGGKYRIIDFTLSNCTNSSIDTVGVLTQYQPLVLNSYIGIGSVWDLDRKNGGVTVLPPYSESSEMKWYKGTASAIYQNINYIKQYDPEYVLILSGDHIYKMDYSKMKVKELKKLCKERKIKGYSKLKKKELIVILVSEKPQPVERGPARMRPMSPLLKKIENLI